MVQMSEVARIRRDWVAAGSPPCAHPVLDKEYHLSAATGDYSCLSCGEDFSREERMGKRD